MFNPAFASGFFVGLHFGLALAVVIILVKANE